MRKYILISGTIFILIYILSQSSLAVEIEKCRDCHGTIRPIPKENITKDCFTCHGMHSSGSPATRNPEDVHSIHLDAGRTQRQSACLGCHQSPVACTNCHNSHDLESIAKAVYKNTANIKRNISIELPSCISCHGGLPQPRGHEEFRYALSRSKHRWMTCDSCHLFAGEDFGKNFKLELHFKNLLTMPIGDSIKICKICHSVQYEGMKEGTHGTLNNTCLSCHNPHTTKLAGPKILITPKETPTNISTKLEESKNWLTTKVPILNNPTAMMIILILLFVFVSEYVLSRHEESQKVVYNMVRLQANEETLKTLEIKLKNREIGPINRILEEYGNILGMTMKKEEDVHKYIIFIDATRPISETDEKDLIGKISLFDDVKSVQFTDKYEL